MTYFHLLIVLIIAIIAKQTFARLCAATGLLQALIPERWLPDGQAGIVKERLPARR